ncbi:rhomboid family intramembrane serine protease [Aquihabitans sp. G128]|uniref:rhomboid family intramembrane serine protease n=1 Tax=Aquihabitans sp. G128 TaxID=2849779 RepID=UPI001C230B86|nr:rhomboid family intramembrane serine protease [Aquihabitans sp. G128]QXC61459.1 rhomboid family intramembrane serine protease [Aquihabitans sp. G128]
MSGDTPERPELDLPGWLRPYVVVALVVAVMWLVELVDLFPHTNLDRWGIRPRRLDGLVGIATSPFLHNGFPHLISNTIPFLVLGGIIATSGVARYFQVTALIALAAGLGTWLIGPSNTDHIGASGIVFGYVTYLLARGVFERRLVYLAVGVAVLFLYGGVLWGLIPRPGISWQMHLFGALGGVLAAWALHATRTEQGKASALA